MHITVKVKNVYGNDLVYPVDENARTFARLVGAKTLNRWQLSLIKGLGYEIDVESGRLPFVV